MNISKLLFDRPDDFEAVVRALHLDPIAFENWANDNLPDLYYASGQLNLEFMKHQESAIEKFHTHIQGQKTEILTSFNACFKLSK